MLKIKLTATEHAALPDLLKSEYKAEGESFVIDTDVPVEDVKPLKNALAQERDQRKLATQKVTTLEAEVTDLKARSGSVTDLEASWKQKLEKAQTDAKAKEDKLNKQLHGLLVDNVATSLAAEISVSPDLIKPHILNRLTVAEEDGGQLVTRVLTADGKASALSVNELKSELVADARYAPIIKGSDASGGGASGGKLPKPGAKAFKDMSEGERTDLFRTNPAEFRKQAAAQNAQPAPAAG